MKFPSATYRIQFRSGMTFDKARELLPYLRDMGISHIYASPIFKAVTGSTHGYDVVHPGRIDPCLGGEEGFLRLLEEVDKMSMGWIQDIVPNHMAFSCENRMLMDILEKGSVSQYFDFFDIQWDHPYDNLKGKLLTPFLGEFYGKCLENRDISLSIASDGVFIEYYENRLPLFIPSYAEVLRVHLEWLDISDVQENPGYRKDKVADILRSFEDHASGDESSMLRLKALFCEYMFSGSDSRDITEKFLRYINSGTPEALDSLHRIISQQVFRLSFWKVGNDELNYRRFFTVNSLISLRVEDIGLFDAAHSYIIELAENSKIDGVRIDHIDGLYAPLVYLRRLRERLPNNYIVVEKILCRDETMPSTWPVEGTTGYDILNYINGVFIDTSACRAMDRFYRSLSGMREDFNDLVVNKKRLFMGKHMAGDIDNLAHKLRNVFGRQRYGSDFTMYGLRRALVEIMAHFPVYRTYISELGTGDTDKFYIGQAVNAARRSQEDLINEFDAIEKLLLSDPEIKPEEEEKEDMRDLIKRFQQMTGPLMAKGAEDTAFYVYNRFISLNEVGGFPEKFGITLEDFHTFNKKRAKDNPLSMNSTSTHDTKRGEDTRARLNVLSEMPHEWSKKVKTWQRANRKYKTRIKGLLCPDKNDEYAVYQTVAGIFPFNAKPSSDFSARIKDYTIKAVREAKVHSSWMKPDESYEKACGDFIDGILGGPENNIFLNDIKELSVRISHYGMLNSLSQTLLKLTLPGVPDIYQGSELWDQSLVDPDNRRSVDFEKRKNILANVTDMENDIIGLVSGIFDDISDGAVKLFLIRRILGLRNKFKDLFSQGEYIPVETYGKYRNNIISFIRRYRGQDCLVVVPRFISGISDKNILPVGVDLWEDTSVGMPEEKDQYMWKNVFTEEVFGSYQRTLVGEILKLFPMAVLICS